MLNAPALTAAPTPPASPRPGLAVAIGGALKHDNDAVWQRLVQESGGAGSRWVVLPTASENPRRAGERTAASLRRFGAQVAVLPVAPKLVGEDMAARRDDPALLAQVADAQGVFFTGGAQELIVDSLRPGGRDSELLRAVRRVFARGGVVAGTSAGAAIMSEWMFRDAQDSLAVLKGRLREGREVDRGLGFVGPDLFIDQHFLKRGRIGRLLPVMVAKGYRLGLGVEENSAALIRDGQVEVIGARGALLVDLSQASTAAGRGAPFALRGARLSFLDRGDRHDIASGVSTPAADKLAGRIDPRAADFKPYHQRAGFYPDMLGDNTIANAMAQLVDSPDAELRGLAFNGRALLLEGRDLRLETGDADPHPELGFEFRLYKTPETLAYYTGAWGGDDYTVLRVALDVTPVTLPQPLYKPQR